MRDQRRNYDQYQMIDEAWFVDRILTRLVVAPNGCWLWQGKPTRQGYGSVNLKAVGDTSPGLVHDIVYDVLVSGAPSGTVIDHLCHTRDETCREGDSCPHRRCANPDHLEPVLHAVNAQRSTAGAVNRARQKARTECKHGHKWTAENTRINPEGHRECRACARAKFHRAKASRRAAA